ncbi:2'-5' RNA ligase family protein [Streptomyces sp. NPDC093252]|uniref:2'-5' RNA ligase family protein n=1 Tax=Streptomyces sp. NPDC093252 TaxID=3154980 RepID=UPI00342DC4DD
MTTHPETMRNHWWWRPGWSTGRRFYTWHLTFEGQDDVHRLAAEYRAALAPAGNALTLIPDQWLHLTMQGIGFVGDVPESDVHAITEAARTRLANIPAFDLEIGPAVLDPEAVLLPVRPDEPVRAVRDSIRAAIGDVLDAVPERAEGFAPHMSVAYSAADGSVDDISQALATAQAAPARARVSTAELITIHRDNLMYEWEPFATVPLG